MERDAHYVAVGAFILLVIAMAVGFVLWYTDANDGREYERYEIYFTGSVSGLDRGSPVRFLGVDVGRVRRLAIDHSDASRVVRRGRSRQDGADFRSDARQPRSARRHRPAVRESQRSVRRGSQRCRWRRGRAIR